jgi:glycosyltransferase involved in cell wall biosynthesis
MRLRLVVPADVEAPTGGNVYDRSAAEALRAAGDDVTLLPCVPADLPAALARPFDGTTLVDGLLAGPQPAAVASAEVAVLVHMPLALETGLAPGRAAELDRLERAALRSATVVVATSRWCALHLATRHGLGPVAVAPPGTDPAPVVTGSEPPLLVQVAALLRHKDQLGVVEALARLTDLPWRARLVGDDDRDPAYAAAVRDAVCSARLCDRVDVPGVLTREAAWAGADLALLPSMVESFGMVVTEGLARGVPVVVGAGTGAEEALGVAPDGTRPGLLVPPGDPDVLSRALRRWLTDAGHRRDLRAAALERRTTLSSWDATAQRLREALTQP